jgi:ribose transport system substrate-binding protein
MHRIRIIGVVAVLALIFTACGGDDGGGTAEPTGDAEASAAGTELSEYGESIDADPALVEKALGPVEDVPDIVLAAIARADQDLDQATIDTAMECWNSVECDTGSGGELIMGVADGGRGNVWRQVTHMEAILQALTYPEIGTIISRDAQWDEDPAVAEADIRFLIQAGADFIIGYPDQGTNIAAAILEAEAAGIPYIPYSAGYVGLPGDEGSLIPGEDYTAIVGEDLCALGESFADIVNTEAAAGPVGIMGGTPGNALSAGWQRCFQPALDDSHQRVGPAADTYWVNDFALQTVLGWLSTDPDITAYAYEYADGMYTALDAYEQLDVPVEDITVVVRTDEQTLFCDWVDRNEPSYRIFFSAGGNFQSRVAVTAAMLTLQDYEVPAEIIVPHVMREVTDSNCDPNRVTPTVSGTSMVPDEVLATMYPEG